MNLQALGGVFVLGLLSTGHCIGMCGGFAAAAASGARSVGGVLVRQILYQAGKATSYVLLGLLLLAAGRALAGRGTVTSGQNIIGAVAGALMILAGLAYALEWRPGGAWMRRWEGSRVCGAVGAFVRSPSPAKSLLVGWLNGFIPCGLSATALLSLVSVDSIPTLVAGAYVFSLGTLPGLFAVSLGWQRLTVSARRWLMRLAGVALILFGAVTIARAFPAVRAWMHGGHGHTHTESGSPTPAAGEEGGSHAAGHEGHGP